MKYLKQFIVGASFPVFALFYYSVENKQPKKNYKYYDYTMIAPLWFGIWNIISLVIAEKYNLTVDYRFLLISVISGIAIMIIATNMKSYNFTDDEWNLYYIYIVLKYLVTWNIIVKFLEYNI